MEEKKIVFIILHYLAEEMTIQCMESIKESCLGLNYHVIIVDNGSDNGSGQNLANRYRDEKNCTVLINEKNLGFAQGNNIGWTYAKLHFNPDFVIIMNNDVLLVNHEFCNKINELYLREQYDLLGPDIYAVRANIHQNPVRLNSITRNEVEGIIEKYEKETNSYTDYKRKHRRHQAMHSLKLPIKKALSLCKPDMFAKVNICYRAKAIVDPVLHGACIIFSKKFISNEKYAFNPNTFLYMEEDILNYYCGKKGYRRLYSSELIVHHLEDISTNMMCKKEVDRYYMKDRELLKSSKVLLNLMDEMCENK